MRSSGFTDFSELLGEGIQIKNPLTGQPFPGNIITIPLNPAAVKYLNAYPAPNCSASVNPNCGPIEKNYTVTRQHIQTINDFDVRGDWIIGKKDSAFVRYSYGNDNLTTTSEFPNLPAGFGSGSNPTKPWSAVMEETHTFTTEPGQRLPLRVHPYGFRLHAAVNQPTALCQPRHRQCQRKRQRSA